MLLRLCVLVYMFIWYWSDKAMTRTRRYLPDEGRPPLGSSILGSMRASANVIHQTALSDQHLFIWLRYLKLTSYPSEKIGRSPFSHGGIS